jgi:type IV pilus assembly protein PilX
MNRYIFPIRKHGCFQHGATLIMTLLMLIVVVLLGLAATQISLQGEKTARNDRDRQIAFQAAEAALLDAETDIEASPDLDKSRSHLFSRTSAVGFPVDDNMVCGRGIQNINLGLCKRAADGASPVWQAVDFLDAGDASASSVPYGRFTGQTFPAGSGSLPAKVPRYIIELMPDKKLGERVDRTNYLYRVTAVGFGASAHTQVALQTVYRKGN